LTVTEYAVAAGLIAASLTATFQTFGLTIDAVILSVIAFM
jgi:Flp pilus assembly pilin Flp